MTHSISIFATILVAAALVSCGGGEDRTVESVPSPVPVVPVVEAASTPAPLPGPAPAPPPPTAPPTPKTFVSTQATTSPPPQSAPRPYGGSASLEERIVAADVIVIARLHSVAANVERYEPKARSGGTSEEEEFVGTLQFTFNVSRYLKGDGTPPTQLKAVVRSLVFSGTREEAQANADRMLAERDTQWDTREAVIFLIEESDDVPVTRSDNVFYMSIWDINGGRTGDQYSIAS